MSFAMTVGLEVAMTLPLFRCFRLYAITAMMEIEINTMRSKKMAPPAPAPTAAPREEDASRKRGGRIMKRRGGVLSRVHDPNGTAIATNVWTVRAWRKAT